MTATANSAPREAFFRALELMRTRALVERDLATLEALHAPEYQLVAPTGRSFTRAEYLGAVEAAPFYAGWDIEGGDAAIQMRLGEGMAILRYRAHLSFPSGRVVHLWHTDSYELRAPGWQAVWSQATGIGQLPPADAGGVRQRIGLATLVVRDYDEAIAFFVQKLGLLLVEDRPLPEQGKRWVVVRPPGAGSAGILLARAATPGQMQRIGDQTGGRVALFLYTNDLRRDHAAYLERGVKFVRGPQAMPYGDVAVFEDLCGNLWDLLQPAEGLQS